MTSVDAPRCTAQYTDQFNTLACTGEHIARYHVAVGTDGAVARMWRDDQPDDRHDALELLDEVIVRLGDLVPRIRGRATDPAVRGVVDAYDRYVQARTGAAS